MTDGKCRINEKGSDKQSASRRGQKTQCKIWDGKDSGAEKMLMLPSRIKNVKK